MMALQHSTTTSTTPHTHVVALSEMRARVRRWYYLVIGSSFFWLFWVLLAVFYSIALAGAITGVANFSFFGTIVWFGVMCVCYFGLTANCTSLAPFGSYASGVFSPLDKFTNIALHFLAYSITVLAVLAIFGRVTSNLLFLACNSGWFCLSAPLVVTIAYGLVFGWIHRTPEPITFSVLQKPLFSKLKHILAQTVVSPTGILLPFSVIFVILIINLRAWIWHFDASSVINYKASIALFLGSLCANFFTKVMYKLVEAFWTKPISFDAPHAAQQRNSHLIAALCDETCVANLHAFMDLHTMSRQSAVRRTALFVDDGGKGWMTVINAVIKQVEELTVELNKATSEVARIKAPEPSKPAKPTTLTRMYLAKVQDFVDNLVNETSKPAFSDRENIVDESMLLFSNMQLYSYAIPALTNLLVHSQTEDKYGVAVVHQSLPSVLCCFVDCLYANDEFCKTVSNVIYKGNPNGLSEELVNTIYSPYTMNELLNNAVYSLVTNFYSSMSYYKYPPKVTERLKLFIDFKE